MAELVSAEPQPVVYLIHDTDRGIYKIGCTRDIHARFKAISRIYPHIKHIHSIQTTKQYDLEQYWHTRFQTQREDREWFSLSEKDIEEFCAHDYMDAHIENRVPLNVRVPTGFLIWIDEQVARLGKSKISKQDLIIRALKLLVAARETEKNAPTEEP